MGAANDNAPIFTPGLDGWRMWSAGRVVAERLTFSQTMVLAAAFKARAA